MSTSSRRQESGFLGSPAAACADLVAWRLHGKCVVDVILGGAGTSTNLNAHEAHAIRAANADDVQALLVPERLTRLSEFEV